MDINGENKSDFHTMLNIAKQKDAKQITNTPEFAEKFAECALKAYNSFEAQTEYLKKLKEEGFFSSMTTIFRLNSDLAKDSSVREKVLTCIDTELKKSEGYTRTEEGKYTKNSENSWKYEHVAHAREIGDIFNQLFKAPDADKDEKLVELATAFFTKELNPKFFFVKTETLIALCSNENFTKNEQLKKLAVDGLVKSLNGGGDYLDGDMVLETLKTKKAREQFVQTINSADEKTKSVILSNLSDLIDDVESEKEKEEILDIVSSLSEKTKNEPELSPDRENKPKSLEMLGGISSESGSTQQPIASSAGRNNNNDRSL